VLQKRQINPNFEESTRSCSDCKDISMTNSANLVHAFERHGEIEYYSCSGPGVQLLNVPQIV
jgi:hypothetical protein